MLSAKQFLFGSLGTAVALSGLTALAPSPTQANPGGTALVISEVYGGGGNAGSTWKSDFVELYNPTDNAIAVDGWTLQGRSATNTAAAASGNSVALTGDVPAHGHYLIKLADGTGGTKALPPVSATGTIAMGAGGWQVWLSNGNTLLDPADGNVSDPAIVDFVGAATNSTSYEGAAANEAPSATLSVQRSATGADSDNNATDFTALTPTPTSAAGETEPVLTATDPVDVVAVVNQPLAAFDLTAANGTPPYGWSATGLPAGVTVSATGTVSGTPTETGTFTVTATVNDVSDPVQTDDVEFTITVNAEPPPLRAIHDVQGTGTTSPEVGNTVRVQGVVTGIFKDPAFMPNNSGGFDGLYVQTAGSGGAADSTPGSDAMFVYGANATPAGVQVGDSVEVTGEVSEAFGTTEITPATGGVVELGSPLAAVTPLAIAYPSSEAAREAQEGMLLAPTDDFTVTSSYNVNTFAEVGLATGNEPLKQPTEFADDDDAAALQAIKDDNLARGVILDDGASVNYMTAATAQDQPLPWLTPAKPIRVGAEATLTGPVILEYRFNTWRFQPTTTIFDDGVGTATFENTRAENAAPAEVGGDLKIATFNVLNYFNTTGEQYVANGAAQNPAVNTQCTYYTDRDGVRIANNTCGVVTNGVNAGNGPRGAATTDSLARQRAKIVTAINLLDADIVGLQEVEASLKLVGETDRDDALRSLVTALNEAAGSPVWRFVHSPGEATVASAVSEQDVIRPAFIYRAASVEPVGQSDILFGTTEFANAREPLAQAFKAKGALDAAAFAVILNHFKSKGDSSTPATGDNANSPDTGAFNGDRTRQATRLVTFANDFAAARGIDAVFLAGDFNSYSMEDPIWTLEQGGFDLIDSSTPGEESYSFSGLSGSLDHVLGNEAAVAMVTGADIWDINAAESVAFQYSRFNYNVTDFWQPDVPFAASDHNPEIVGINVDDVTGSYKEIQVLGTNDFHGRILPSGGDSAGASVLSGAVKQLREDNPNTVFVAAGDLVGASTFESFIQNDEPTIDALNEAGLEVSAAGNHEFDQGYEDFVGRIQAGASWEYIAANVVEPEGRDDLAETWTKEIDGVKVGFVGAVTEDLPSLVNPSLIEGVSVTDIVDATNTAAAALKADGAELIILLVHEGSASTDCSSPNFLDENTVWGNITQNVSADVDAIVSGHTHLAYNCSFTVDQWATDGRAVTKRPVVSAGQYGQNLNQLRFTYDAATDDLVGVGQDVIGIAGTGYPGDSAVDPIVADAVAQAEVLGAVKLGQIEAPFNRAKLANGTSENRGGESTLGNLVAEVQRWATEAPESGAAQIAFMNPGGLRQDMAGTVNGDARDLTYKQAAVVQPFANTLVNMDLTGAQIETVLEQQWQRTSGGAVPSRPFLRLGVSEGFTYTYVETPAIVSGVATFQGEVTGMWLDGVPIGEATTYSVTVNSFLASGGDNFFAFAAGAGKADTGKVDLQAMVDYMATHAASAPLPVDYSQRGVEVEFPGDAPASYEPGGIVSFGVSSWTMSTADDVKDTEVQVKLGDQVLGSFPLDNTIGTAVYDAYGTATVAAALPADTAGGAVDLTLVGAQTGTSIVVPITVTEADPVIVNDTPPVITGTAKVGRRLTATAGTWTPAPTSVAYQWLANGTPIAGATGSTLVLKAAQVGKRVSVRVTAKARAHIDAVATSAQTAAVVKGNVTLVNRIAPTTRIVVNRTRVTVAVRPVNADGVAATGTVLVRIGTKTWSGTLSGGRVEIPLGVMRTAGLKTVYLRYLGNASLAEQREITSFTAVR